MVSWLIIGVLIVIAVIALKINHLRHKIWIVAVILLVIFLYMTVSLVYKENELKVDNTEDFFHITKVYLGWLGNGFNNLKSLTGYAVKLDWGSSNTSFMNKTLTKAK